MNLETNKTKQIDEAIFEANRFINRAKSWKIRIKTESLTLYGSKEGGACKRASLDLSRALSAMRKPL